MSEVLDTPETPEKRSPAFQFYPRDFLSSGKVDDMSMTERGVYITLLSRCWLDGGLPTDMGKLARMARMMPVKFERMWTVGPLHECFYVKGEQFQNERLDKERKVQADFRKRAKEAAAVRWDKPKQSKVDADASSRHNGSNALQSASSSAICNPLPQKEKETRPSRSGPRTGLLKPNGNCAFDGPRVHVPWDVYHKLVKLKTDDELQAFFAVVSDEWTTGARRDDEPGPNMFKFWDARYEEKWPATVTPKAATSHLPAWAQKAKAQP